MFYGAPIDFLGTFDDDGVFYGAPVSYSVLVELSTATFTDYVCPLADSLTADSPGGSDSVVLADSLTTSYSYILTQFTDPLFNLMDGATGVNYLVTSFTDYIVLNDSATSDDLSREDASISASVTVIIREGTEYSGSVSNIIRERVNSGFSVSNVIKPNSMVPITSATAVGNPVQPTYIQNGTVVYSSTATLPAGDVSRTKCYVSFKCADLIGPRNADEIISYSLSINNGNGSWEANTTTDVGDYYEQVQLFGLTGTIVDKGFSWSSSSGGVINGGILSNPKLNRDLGFLTYGNPNYFFNVPNASLNKPATSRAKSHRDAVSLIAQLAGVTVSWAIPDLPLVNFQPQMSQKAVEAMASLAQEAGGVLRWTGGDSYIVTYPDKQIGYFEVPDCCLITSMGMKCSADMNTGIYSPGVYAVPQLGQYNAGTKIKNGVLATPTASGPGNTTGSAILAEDFYTTTKLVTADDPIQFVNLPFDFDSIYIQNVCKVDGQGPFVTLDPQRRWPLQTGFAGEYVNCIDIGGKLQPVLKISPDFFPSETNTDVADGHWYMKIQITRKPLSGGSDSGNSDGNEDTEGRTMLRYRFIPTCVGTINCAFFGSIPLPGMFATATANGETVSGIVESVSFQNPGLLSIQVVQWSRLQFYQQLSGFSNF